MSSQTPPVAGSTCSTALRPCISLHSWSDWPLPTAQDVLRWRHLHRLWQCCRSPVYPPRAVSFSIGHRLVQLHALPQVYGCNPSHEWQSFQLPESAPVGSYLKVPPANAWLQSWCLILSNIQVSGDLFPDSMYQQLPATLSCLLLQVTIHGSAQKQVRSVGSMPCGTMLSRCSSLILGPCVQWSDHLYYTALREVQVLGHLPSPSVVRDFMRCQRVCSSLPQKVTEASDPQQPVEQACERVLLRKQGQRAGGMCLYSAVHQLPLSDQPPDIKVSA